MNLNLEKRSQDYFEKLNLKVEEVYEMANKARAKGYDPLDKVEIPLAKNMAEKVVSLISTIYPQMMESQIAERISSLEEEYGKLDPTVVFKIAEEVSEQKYCKFNNILECLDAGIRIGMCYITLGVVSSPLEGFTGLEIGKTRDRQEYIIANFSGPIRSAGTTASCLTLLLIDFLREKFGFAKYDPTEEEVRRVWTELSDFHERVTNLQYMPTEEEAIFLAKHMPIQIAGDPSETLEVSNYKNLPRVNTNFLRSGFCLVLAEGLAQKAAKGFRLYNMARKNGITGSGFDWLNEYVEIHERNSKGKAKSGTGPPTYIKDLVAGRPVYGHPSRSGSFRFRYGRSRNSGFSSAAVHPATMGVTDNFLAIGTQLKIEKPTKGCAITSCDCLEGPIVKLKNGSVLKLTSKKQAQEIYDSIDEIIYLGDILIPFSDVANRNSYLLKQGYVEEWWLLELKEKNIPLYKEFKNKTISLIESVEIGNKEKLPLHPKYIFYWKEISNEEFFNLIRWMEKQTYQDKIILPWTKKDKEIFSLGKRALELLGIPHEVFIENVIINKENSLAFLFNLGIENPLKVDFKKYFKVILEIEGKTPFQIINELCSLEIKDKSGDFIGARMGRPEKAKLRKLTGSPNMLFSVGNEGGRLRSLQSAMAIGKISSQYSLFECENCNKRVIFPKCPFCDSKTQKKYFFSDTKELHSEKKNKFSEKEGIPYLNQTIEINEYLKASLSKLGMGLNDLPELIKGVRGVSSDEKSMENLAKGILRARYDLQVNKDGTIRMDATELPLTHFKPFEIGASLDKLRELGYVKDIYGEDLISESQILELMPHDVLIPDSLDTPDERGGDLFLRISYFIDDLLEKFYGLPRFYNFSKKEDLIGQLGVCMAPHNCAGVICRFIGFSKTLGLMASPYMHAAIRRDCDGDEAAIMLLGDVLINFSKKYLPSHRGGTQDAPLVLNSRIDAGEVDDQILDMEYVDSYPLELYRLAEERKHSSEVQVYNLKKLLKEGKDPFFNIGFTHDTLDFNEGVTCSSYKSLENMEEKVSHQMKLVEKLRSVDTTDTARLIIERHFIRDLRGNLRKFSMQNFRCVDCNEIIRRPPLDGKCPACSGKIIFTIHEGGIKKYLDPAMNLAQKYNVSSYLKQTLDLVRGYIDSIFGKETEKQKNLEEWFNQKATK